MIEEVYRTYTDYTNLVINTGDISQFKSNNNYTYVLEHVDIQQGKQYLNLIQQQTKISDEDIRAFSALNDSIGRPRQELFTVGFLSPSNLRYLFHAHLILTHMKIIGELTPRIVEIGGGYGGLCLAISFLSKQYGVKPQGYVSIDLEAPSKLQAIFLGKFSLNYPVEFVRCDTYGKDISYTKMFLISNYCFSEISDNHQRGYISTLFPKVSHGFMAWNHIPVYDFGFPTNIEKEYPLTGSLNKYVWF